MFKQSLTVLLLAGGMGCALSAWAETYHVSPAGTDTAAGTASAPWRTIQRAVQAGLKPGDTVLIKSGTYPEAVELAASGTAQQPILFQAEKPGSVVVTGADVLSSWTREAGDALTVYSVPWSHDFYVGKNRDGSKLRNHMARSPVGNAEQVIWNGRPLRQVVSHSELQPGTFYVDWDSDRLFVSLPGGRDPNQSQVLSSTRGYLFGPRIRGKDPSGNARYVTVRGIVFRYGANFAQRGLVRAGTGWRFEDCVVEWANAGGLAVVGDDVVLLRVTARLNGQAGLLGNRIKNLLVKDSIQWGNNWKGFSPSGEASTKFVRTDNVRIENMLSYGNTGPGIWFDWNNTNVVIEGSTFYGNRGLRAGWEGIGIFIEASPGPVILRNNTVYSNTGAGINIAESQNVLVENNTLVDNGTQIELRAMEKRANHKLENVVVQGNRLKGARNVNIGTSLGKWNAESAIDRRIRIDGNTYDPKPNQPIFRWAKQDLQTLDDVRSRLRLEGGGVRKTIAFTRPLVPTRTVAEQKATSIDDTLARVKEGSTATIAVNGRTELTRAVSGWTVDVYDLANRYVRLTLSDDKLRAAIESRVTPYPLSEPVSIRLKLTKRGSEAIEAIALEVSP